MGLPSFSLKRPVLTAMIFIAVTLLGVISLARLQIELYQGSNQGIISIIVRARGGLPPQEVEKMITKPVEEAVATVSRLKRMYSNSRESESRVTLQFTPGTNMKFAALEIREKFARVKPLLPSQIEKPVIANYDDSQSAILIFAVTSETMSPEDIREIVDDEMKPLLSRVDGVASVEVYGGRERKILIELDREKMVAYNIAIERVMDIIGQSNINLLAGSVEQSGYDLAIRTMGSFLEVDEIGELGIKASRQGTIIPLKEIATIKDAYMERSNEARLNLEQNVTVYVKKASASNTLTVADSVRAVLKEFEMQHKESLKTVIVNDQAKTISKAIGDVKQALYLGLILTIIVIYGFMRKLILAAIVLICIPVSIFITFIAMAFFGISINVMTLSGLALSMGILVDSAVVVIENIFAKKEKKLSDTRSIRTGAEEVWMPLLASMMTTLVVFLPIVLVDKTIQQTYGGFAFTVTCALLASFFVALMLVPMLIRQFARGRLNVDTDQSKGWVMGPITKAYKWFMGMFLESNFFIRLLGLVLVFLIAIFSVLQLKEKSIDWPTTYEENEFSIIVFPLAGARLEANDEAITNIENILKNIPDVELYSSTVTKDKLSIFVRLKEKSKRTFSKDEVMQFVDEKAQEAVKDVHEDYGLVVDEGASSSETKKLVVEIFGHENRVLETLAKQAAQEMNSVDGITNMVMTDLRKRPEYALVVDKGRAAYYGLTVKDVADSVHSQIRGMRPTKFRELTKGQEIETITRLQAIYRQKLDDIKLVHVATDENTQVPLQEIANFYPTVGPQMIDRKNKYRYVFVKGDVKRPIEEVADDVTEKLNKIKMPDDYYWQFGGEYEDLMESKIYLLVALVVTLFLVYMVMACLFQSYTLPILIMMTVPMALVGVWIGLDWPKLIDPIFRWIPALAQFKSIVPEAKPLSQQVFIGVILLSGYVVNAAIIMVDHMKQLMQKGEGMRKALLHAGLDRIRPIMMTTCSTVLGFMPMALSVGQSSDLWSPLAITVIGGLMTSTILTLFVLPHLILILEDIKTFFLGELITPQVAEASAEAAG